MMLANSAAAIVQFRLAQLGEGVVAAYGYAARLHGALAQVLVIGLGTVLLPHFAGLWSRGETAEIEILFRRLARFTVLIIAIVTPGIILMGETATKLLFQRGVFDAAQTELVSHMWALLSLSLFPFALGTFIAKFCQAVRDASSIFASGVVLFASTWAITWLGAYNDSLNIVVSASAGSFLTACCFWLFWLKGRISTLPVLVDIAMASLRIGLILIPAVAAERWCNVQAHDLPAAVNLILRSGLYAAVTSSLLIVTRSHTWFFSRRPGVAR